MTNRLAHESSPYLQQHAQNPVDWYPWGEEALALARAEQKPIFLSIGYSACHWCHVMEHESFENPQIADFLNRHFVSIKVDREERPDLDQIYMQAVQLMTHRGGWPMSVFLTPELKPFYGGTYWPPRSSRGMPGFDQVLAGVLDAWTERREQVVEQARLITAQIGASSQGELSSGPVDPRMLRAAAAEMASDYDGQDGGFGQAPKFPHSMGMQFLLRMAYRDPSQRSRWLEPVCGTLDKMAAGGIYDHLAGGFARYSVDAKWLVPHFEKMLYDNALLADAYLDAFQLTHDPRYAQVAREIGEYVLTYMTDPAGGFHSAEDADSEGEEGTFYVWTRAEIDQILGVELGSRFCKVYGVTDFGNFEGSNILHLSQPITEWATTFGENTELFQDQMQQARRRLLDVRDLRERPHKDDKILTSWNGLMIHSLARMGAILQEPRFTSGAVRASEFLWSHLRRPARTEEGRETFRLLHTWRRGTAKIDGYLDDYANFANALMTLYEITLDPVWIGRSAELVEQMRSLFRDPDGTLFFYTAHDQEPLVARTKDYQDNATPSGNSMAALVLLRLGHLTQQADLLDEAEQIIRASTSWMARYPLAFGQMLVAADFAVGPVEQVVLSVERDALVWLEKDWHRHFLPYVVRAAVLPPSSPDTTKAAERLQHLLQGKPTPTDEPRIYVCQRGACQPPVTGRDAILSALGQLGTTERP